MKIKQKKQLNLSQLIEWGFEKGIINEEYVCNEHKSKSVIFNLSGWAEFSDEFSYNPHDTFTVTTEEEITEDTVLSKLTCYTAFGFKGTKYNISINDVKSHNPLAFYIMNDDLTMTLIWTHEKGLVE